MSNGVNNKRVFCVQPHRPQGFGEILGKRGDIRLDMLEQKKPEAAALEVLSAAHAYQTSSARDELAQHYHTRTDLLSKTPSLLIVSTNGAGYDTVDVNACTGRGVLVVNQSGGNAEAVAEHVLGMMLCLVKRMPDLDRALRAGAIKNRNDYTSGEAFGRTIGIVGLGNVGRRIAELAGILFKMKVLAYDPYLSADVAKSRGAEKVELDELLKRADFVSINCPLTPETRRLIGAREFALMKPDAFFITTARGSIHDEEALEQALRDNKLAGAGLDVLGKGTAAGQSSADEIRQRDGHPAHGRRHQGGAHQNGPDRGRADARRARRQGGRPHRQSASLAGLCQAIRKDLRLCTRAAAGRAELARGGEARVRSRHSGQPLRDFRNDGATPYIPECACPGPSGRSDKAGRRRRSQCRSTGYRARLAASPARNSRLPWDGAGR